MYQIAMWDTKENKRQGLISEEKMAGQRYLQDYKKVREQIPYLIKLINPDLSTPDSPFLSSQLTHLIHYLSLLLQHTHARTYPNIRSLVKQLSNPPSTPENRTLTTKRILYRDGYKGNLPYRERRAYINHFNSNNLPYVRQWNVEELNINDYMPTIQPISNINFINLRRLSYHSNGINSIEDISSFYMPNLQEVNFSNNRISNVKEIRKSLFPSLNYFLLEQNPLLDTWWLSQFYVRTKASTVLIISENPKISKWMKKN